MTAFQAVITGVLVGTALVGAAVVVVMHACLNLAAAAALQAGMTIESDEIALPYS